MRKLLFAVLLSAVLALSVPVKEKQWLASLPMLIFVKSPAAAATPFDLAFVTSAVSTSAATAYTFNSQSIGAANATRNVIVCAGGEDSDGSSPTLSQVTVDGNNTSSVVTNTSGAVRTAIRIVALASGTSVSIVVTWSGSGMDCCGISVYRLVGANATATASTSDITLSSNALSASLTIPTGGAGLGYVFCESEATARTYTWTNLTEDMDQTVNSTNGNSHSSASSSTAGTATRTATASSTEDEGVLLLAAWGP